MERKSIKHQKKRKGTKEEWIRQMRSIYIMEYNPAIKKNEIMPLEATWMNADHPPK